MEVSVTDAKAQLTELVRKAEAGEEVVLTRHGHPAVRLIPVKKKLSPHERRAILEEIMAFGAANGVAGAKCREKPGFSLR